MKQNQQKLCFKKKKSMQAMIRNLSVETFFAFAHLVCFLLYLGEATDSISCNSRAAIYEALQKN